MLLTVGDLVEDIAVALGGPIRTAADTPSTITRRRGGSAANVAVAAATAGFDARFVGQVGDDAIGRALTDEMGAVGVDVGFVRRHGTTGTIVALVDASGERSMLTDRRACVALTDPTPDWLDGIDVVHVPLYSFAEGQLAETARTVVRWAHGRTVSVSVDLSSTTVLDALGRDAVAELLRAMAPAVVLANADEAAAFGVTGAIGDALTVVKHGADPTVIHRPQAPLDPVVVAPTERFDGIDTTGAGDAFAAGFLTATWRDDPAGAVAAGHRLAARLLAARVTTVSP